jgi:hypothetical protein
VVQEARGVRCHGRLAQALVRAHDSPRTHRGLLQHMQAGPEA